MHNISLSKSRKYLTGVSNSEIIFFIRLENAWKIVNFRRIKVIKKVSNPFINSIVSWFLKKRSHQIDLFIKYPNEVQNDVLINLINTAKDTEIGKEFDFKSIKNYRDFSNRIPVFKYEDFSEKISRARKGEDNIFGQAKLNGLQNLVVLQILKVNLFQ